MVKRRSLILFILLLLILGLTLSAGWLLTSRAGALWLFARAGGVGPVKLELQDLKGSLLGGVELRGLRADWPQGRLSVDRLQLAWTPLALWQQRLQLELLQVGTLDLQLARLGDDAPPEAADPVFLIPELGPVFERLGGWSLELQKLEVASIRVVSATGQEIALRQLGGSLLCSAAQARLGDVQFDSDFGRWRGSVQLTAAESLLTGELSGQTPASFAPLKKLEASLRLQRNEAGGLRGPVKLLGETAQGIVYRLAGGLSLAGDGLQLQKLQFDHGTAAAGLVQGELGLNWQSPLSWYADLELRDLDLIAELGRTTKLGGRVALQGGESRYAGRVDLHNECSGWELLSLSGDLQGDSSRLDLTQLQGRLLRGQVAGDIGLEWREGLSSLFKLKGVNLNLAQIPDGPDGIVDLQLDGWLRHSAETGVQLGGAAQLTRGTLLGRELSGDLRADWRGGRQLRIDHLALSGAWGQLRAEGALEQQLALDLELLDAAALWPGLEGAGALSGWLAWNSTWPHGRLTGHLKNLVYQDWRVAGLVLDGEQLGLEEATDLRLSLTELQKGAVELAELELKLQGLPRAHRIQLQIGQSGRRLGVELQGALQSQAWQGRVTALDLSAQPNESYHLTKPVEISFEPAQLRVSDIQLQGDQGGGLSLSADWNRLDESRRVEGGWQKIRLNWLEPWLAGAQLAGESSGHGSFNQDRTGGITFDLQADYVGNVIYAGQELQLDRAQIDGSWDRQQLVLRADLEERSGGQLSLLADSVADAGFYLPQSGSLQLVLKDLPLELFNAQLPAGRELEGLLAAEVSGRWFNEGRFALTGELGVEQGVFFYHDGQSRLEIPFDQTRLNIDWQQAELAARVSLGLGAGDGLAGDLSLQLPAHWPFELGAQLPISGELQFRLGKLGALSLLVPESLADFSGALGGALRLAGSLQQPKFAGDLQLRDGRLSLRQLGIVLDQIGMQAVLDAQQLRIEQLSLRAGEGELHGRGEVLFNGWQPEKFTLELKGENAMIANLPELRALASPDLQLVGSAEGLTLSGLLKIPELQIINWHPAGRVVRSTDVVYVDQLPKPQVENPLNLKLALGVELGERVVVKDRGLDVRLGGKVRLDSGAQGGVLARGQIDIPTGNYSAYGVKLPITSGRLYFNGGAADNPALDIIAAKKVGEVSAGVAVGGTARQPVIRLVSDPALDDTDILSYIVLGRPTLGGSGDFSVLSLAAGALLSAGDSASFQQKLKNRSGIDVIDVNPGGEGLETAVVTVGKYLTPELYLSYGRALSSGISQLQLRYSPSPRVDIESQIGEVSGADLYYRIEFD